MTSETGDGKERKVVAAIQGMLTAAKEFVEADRAFRRRKRSRSAKGQKGART